MDASIMLPSAMLKVSTEGPSFCQTMSASAAEAPFRDSLRWRKTRLGSAMKTCTSMQYTCSCSSSAPDLVGPKGKGEVRPDLRLGALETLHRRVVAEDEQGLHSLVAHHKAGGDVARGEVGGRGPAPLALQPPQDKAGALHVEASREGEGGRRHRRGASSSGFKATQYLGVGESEAGLLLGQERHTLHCSRQGGWVLANCRR